MIFVQCRWILQICYCKHQTQLDLSSAPDLSHLKLTCTSSSHQQQMLLHCQMAYKANCTTLILCVASIKNWIETDKIRLCLQDLTKCKSLLGFNIISFHSRRASSLPADARYALYRCCLSISSSFFCLVISYNEYCTFAFHWDCAALGCSYSQKFLTFGFHSAGSMAEAFFRSWKSDSYQAQLHCL